MAIRAVPVVTGPAGTDWAFIVPGQWYPYLYGVTATLRTATGLSTLTDETGNGHDATLFGDPTWVFPASGPYAAGVDNGSVFHPNSPNPINGWFAATAASLAFGPANFTVDGWYQAMTPTELTDAGDFWGFFGAPGGQLGSLNVRFGLSDPLDLQIVTAGVGQTVLTGFMSRNVWHHVATTWDGATWRFYRDGALIGSTGLKPFLGAGNTNIFRFPGDSGIGAWRGYVSGLAVYPAALAVGNIAAHAAATGSAAAYKAAVLADTPTAYWGLNALPKGLSRTVTLKVTDGTRTVAQYPAAFPSATQDSFTWSWQALGPGAAASTDGRINSVPIPEIRVDAGYVIRATTLDLGGTDQWGPITLWFDDGTGPGQPGPPGGDPLAFRSLLLLG